MLSQIKNKFSGGVPPIFKAPSHSPPNKIIAANRNDLVFLLALRIICFYFFCLVTNSLKSLKIGNLFHFATVIRAMTWLRGPELVLHWRTNF